MCIDRYTSECEGFTDTIVGVFETNTCRAKLTDLFVQKGTAVS